MGRNILVTGGSGFIGAALVRRLAAEGHRVFIFTRPGSSMERLEGLEEKLGVCVGDLRSSEAVTAAVEAASPDVVYHLASTPFNPPTISPQAHLETIVMGAANLVQALVGRGTVRVVAAGSAAEYGSGRGLREDAPLRPATLLGTAKASATLWFQMAARLYGLSTVVLRLFMPYGPGEHPGRLVPHVILSALAGRDVPLTAGEQERDLVYIDDVVEALCLAGARPVAPGSVLNIGSGQGTRIRDVVAQLLALMGRSEAARFGALPTRPDEIMQMSADITAAREQLDWSPRVALEEGLRHSITWCSQPRHVAEASVA